MPLRAFTLSLPAAAIAAAVLGPTALSEAQWTATNLNAAGFINGRINGIGGGQQVGVVQTSGPPGHAALWAGTAGSFVDLSPAGANGGSSVSATDGATQVGYAYFLGRNKASLWSGSAGSWVSLDPPSSQGSWATAVDAGHQVGAAVFANHDHASLWSGTAGSWIDLNPAGAINSVAYGISGSQQVGSMYTASSSVQASLWSGTAASWVNLNPTISASSTALGVWGGYQVGWVDLPSAGDPSHAALWNGTATSLVDLNPANATVSRALAIYATYQVGEAMIGGSYHAVLWHNRADSVEDLSISLPETWNESHATSVWIDGSTLYVGGYAAGTTYAAFLWSRPIPGPATTTTLIGAAMLSFSRRRRNGRE